MGSDDQINRAIFQTTQSFLHLFIGLETRDWLDGNWESAVALDKCVVVLTNQQGCWHQHGNLLAVLDGFEGSANRHLGFAIANISCQQAIHRDWLFHIPLHFLNGR